MVVFSCHKQSRRSTRNHQEVESLPGVNTCSGGTSLPNIIIGDVFQMEANFSPLFAEQVMRYKKVVIARREPAPRI